MLKSPTAIDSGADGAEKVRRARESACSVAQNNGDRIAAGIGRDQIGFAVSIEIPRGDRMRTGSDCERAAQRRREGTRSVAEKQCYVAVVEISRYDIRIAVAVEIAHRQRFRFRSHRERTARRRRETARSIIEEHGYGIIRGIRRHDVRQAVAIYVHDRERPRTVSNGERTERISRENTLSVAPEHGYAVGRRIRRDDIEVARTSRSPTATAWGPAPTSNGLPGAGARVPEGVRLNTAGTAPVSRNSSIGLA